jgi:hypothetical protein
MYYTSEITLLIILNGMHVLHRQDSFTKIAVCLLYTYYTGGITAATVTVQWKDKNTHNVLKKRSIKAFRKTKKNVPPASSVFAKSVFPSLR